MAKAYTTKQERLQKAKDAIESIQALAGLKPGDIKELLSQFVVNGDQQAVAPTVAPKQPEPAPSVKIAGQTTKDTAPNTELEPDKEDQRGFKGRNGRWMLLNKMFDEVGFNKTTTELFDEANRRSVAAGLTPLKKTTFYSMLSVAKRAAKGTDTK